MKLPAFAMALALLLLSDAALANELLPVQPEESSRFAAVGRINTGTGTYCTGALIRQDIALTSAHCLFNRRTGRWLIGLPPISTGHPA